MIRFLGRLVAYRALRHVRLWDLFAGLVGMALALFWISPWLAPVSAVMAIGGVASLVDAVRNA